MDFNDLSYDRDSSRRTRVKEATFCNACDSTVNHGQWWYLSDYYKLYGVFCNNCYSLIAHDAYGVPKNPTGYKIILTKMKLST